MLKSTLMYVSMVGLIVLQIFGLYTEGLDLTRVVIILLALVVMSQQAVIDSKERMQNRTRVVDQ